MLDNVNGDNVIHGHWPPRPAIPRLAPPTVEVRRIKHREGDLLVIERCVYCGRKHMHGVGPQKDCGSHGHRLAHCVHPPNGAADIRRGYYLYEPCEQQPPPPPKRGRSR